jgi:hypothetical protein
MKATPVRLRQKAFVKACSSSHVSLNAITQGPWILTSGTSAGIT